LEEPWKNAINKKLLLFIILIGQRKKNPSGYIQYWSQFFWFMGGEGQDILFIFWM